ncbi:MAG: BamA/TamA family outer membrane protein [Gammaproteobacteria bacterium]|nr:BamA/TamA family outer membrane protein [Gammaproteobacteria bacterium]
MPDLSVARLRCLASAGILLTGVLGAASPARAQLPVEDAVCEEGPVSRIIIESRPIFDPGPPSQPRILRWTRGLANFMHVDTREGFIAGELLFGEGDCPDLFLFEESERILRELGFIATADIVAEPQPDGTRHVRVTTRDEWTTKIQIDVTVDDGLQFEGASVVEENFLGSGNLIGAFYQERKQRRDYGLTLHSTRLAGTRLDGRLNVGRTRSGGFTDAMLVYPFVGEVGRFAGRVRFHRRESLFPYVLDPSLDYSYALLPVFGERIEATQAYRFGEPGDLTLLGFGVTHETLRFDEYPDSVSLVRGLDFGNLLDDEPGIGFRLAHQTRAHELTRFNLLLARRKVRFETRTGLDAVSGEQSVPQGVDLSLTLGPRLPLGRGLSGDDASAPGAPAGLASDFMGRVSFFGGVGSASALLLVNAETEARRVRFEDESEGRWRDILSEADLLAYWQPGVGFARTLVARVSAAGGWNTISPFQLTLGGREVVRGYKEEDFPAGRRVVASLENRVDLGWPAPSSMDLGLTFFADAGRAWAGDVPFGMDTGWKSSVGAGLRLGFPAGSVRATRIDLAWPVGADSGRGPMFRATTGDFIGLVRGFADEQMVRSRRSGVNPNFEGVSR